MRAIARRGKWPQDAVVLFAGRARDKLTSALVRRFAGRPELATAVRFLDAVKDIRSLYWASDLLVMPSLYEGLANAALEGCAAGLPAILSHAANVDGIVRPGETGWEVPTLRHAPLVEALEAALATPADRLAEMGRAGRAHVTARFAPRKDHVLDQMVAVYDELLAGTGPGHAPRLGPMTATARRPFAIVLIALAVAAFCGAAAQPVGAAPATALRRGQLSRGRARLSTRSGARPARSAATSKAGATRTTASPAYMLVLQAFAHDAPGFYADAKLLSLAIALLLMALAGVLAWRVFSPATGVATVALLALLPTLGEIASGVLADVMYAAVLLACVTAIGAALERGPLAWLGAGAMIGLAYLTKGNGHLAFLGLVTAGVAVRGRRLLLGPHIYVAAAGFVAVTWFLLWRNAVVFRNPFHNFNDHALWLDGWNDVWRVLRDPEWDRVGPRWYLQHHSVWALAWRVIKGAGQSIGVLIYTAGPGVTAGTPAHLKPTIPAAIAARRRRRGGHGAGGARSRRSLPDRTPRRGAGRDARRWLDAAGVRGRRAGRGRRRDALHAAVRRAVHPLRGLRAGSTRATAGARRRGSHARGRASRCSFPSRSSWPGSRPRSPRTRATRSRCRPRWAETSAWLRAHLRPASATPRRRAACIRPGTTRSPIRTRAGSTSSIGRPRRCWPTWRAASRLRSNRSTTARRRRSRRCWSTWRRTTSTGTATRWRDPRTTTARSRSWAGPAASPTATARAAS